MHPPRPAPVKSFARLPTRPHPQVVLPSSSIKSFTDEKPTVKKGDRVKYGKYDLIKPFTLSEMRLHYENKLPFKQVPN